MGTPKSSNLCMETREHPGGVVIFVCGSIDMVDVPQFRDELEKYAAETNFRVIVEFTGLEFIGGAGLDALVSAYDLGKKNNTKIVMAGDNMLVRRIMEITCLNRIIPIYPDIEGAFSR